MFCCNLKTLILCFEIEINVFQGQFISKTIYCCSQRKHYISFGIYSLWKLVETVGHPLSLESEELPRLPSLCLDNLVWKWAVTQNVMMAVSYMAKLPEAEAACFPRPGQRLMLACSRLLFII